MDALVEFMTTGTAIAACVVVAIIPLAALAIWWAISGTPPDEEGPS